MIVPIVKVKSFGRTQYIPNKADMRRVCLVNNKFYKYDRTYMIVERQQCIIIVINIILNLNAKVSICVTNIIVLTNYFPEAFYLVVKKQNETRHIPK